jgi:hypothetical protein
MQHAGDGRRGQERPRTARVEDLIAQLSYLAPEVAKHDGLAGYMVTMAIQILRSRHGLQSPSTVAE